MTEGLKIWQKGHPDCVAYRAARITCNHVDAMKRLGYRFDFSSKEWVKEEPVFAAPYGLQGQDGTPRTVKNYHAQADAAASALARHIDDKITQSILEEHMQGEVNHDKIKAAQQALDQAIAEKAEADAAEALTDRLNYDSELASATSDLLFEIRTLLVADTTLKVQEKYNIARFRKELQPLAETYGVKIVLIGDRSTATLVKVS